MTYSQLSGDQMTVWVAQEKGVFARNGLDVTVSNAPSNTGVASLISNQTQIAVMGGADALGATINGADLMMVATLSPVYAFKFEVAGDIKTKQDLVGKKVSITRRGGTADIGTHAGLRKIGLDPDKDVTYISVDTAPLQTAALISGSVQGAMIQPPDTVKVEASGMHPLFDYADLGLAAASAVVNVRKSWLAQNHDVVQRFVDSIVQATALEKQDQAGTEAIISKYLKVDDKQLLDATYDYYVHHVHPTYPTVMAAQFADIQPVVAANDA
ncbi:MAG: ABC transporter substrate-binding protein, partial [Chloroflexi bacterium]|nr:ABC transporter substrate-binding protein [Chloroflexota bacterium]